MFKYEIEGDIMFKSSAIDNLENAKRSHIKWVNRAKAMVDSKNAIRDPHPMSNFECSFGKWFMGDGEKIYKLLGTSGFEEIDKLHQLLHDRYLLIYELYFGSAEGIIYNQKAKLEKINVSKMVDDMARAHFQELRDLSYKMIQKIEELEDAINSSSDFL